jgi:peptidoglycan hydrolase-like protein with peptidoglycan-binding domain
MHRRGITIVVFLALTAGNAAAKDLATMSREEVTALQRRLSDAGCYKGAIDGAASAATDAAVKACPAMDPILSIETGMHPAAGDRFRGQDGAAVVAARRAAAEDLAPADRRE